MEVKRGKKQSLFVWIVLISTVLLFLGCPNKKTADVSSLLDRKEDTVISEDSPQVLYVSTMDVPPWGFTSWSGEPTGILVDTANYIGEKLNFEIVHQVVPFSRCMFDLENGDADLWMGFDNKFVAASAVHAGEVIELNTIVIGRDGIEFSSLPNLQGKTIATVQDAQYNPLFTNDDKIIKYSTQNYEQSIQMLLNNRVDGVIGPEIGLYYIVREMGHTRLELGEPLYLETRMGYIFYSNKTLNPEIQAKLQKFTTSKEYQDQVKVIIDKYIN